MQVASRNRREFDARVARVYPKLLAYCVRLCPTRSDAEDLAQAALLKAWRVDPLNTEREGGTRYNPSTMSWIGWCKRLAAHELSDSLRRKRLSTVSLTAMVEDPPVEGHEDGVCERGAVSAFLAELDVFERKVLGLVIAGHSMVECATLLHVPVSHVYAVHAALRDAYSTTIGNTPRALQGNVEAKAISNAMDVFGRGSYA